MNKDNAHLYLPLVQALVEGKTIQYSDRPELEQFWIDKSDPNFSWEPERYRIKPLSFPPKPEGMEWHLHDELTPELCGPDHRPFVKGESADQPHEVYIPGKKRWLKATRSPSDIDIHDSAYRLPISTPYPDGSYVKDGQLVKPWVPKFKAGDRVKVIASTYNPVDKTKERIGQAATVIEDRELCVDVRFADHARWSYAQADLEPAPEPKPAPLCAEDINPSDVFKGRMGGPGFYKPVAVEPGGILFVFGSGTKWMNWEKLKADFVRLTPGHSEWQPCSKLP